MSGRGPGWTIDFDARPEDVQFVANVVKEAIGAGIDGMEKDLSG